MYMRRSLKNKLSMFNIDIGHSIRIFKLVYRERCMEWKWIFFDVLINYRRKFSLSFLFIQKFYFRSDVISLASYEKQRAIWIDVPSVTIGIQSRRPPSRRP